MIPGWEEIGSWSQQCLAKVPADVLAGKVPAALYGMGFLGRWALPQLKLLGIEIESCFDGNKALDGTRLDGTPVHSSDHLAEQRPAFTFIAARHAVPAVAAMLAGLGLPSVSCDAFWAARQMAAFETLHHDRLSDDRSQLVLRAVLATMLTGDRRYLQEAFDRDQYFCLPPFLGVEPEIYVDAGAYVGDSLERFIWAHYGIFRKAIAFEPGPRQRSALALRVSRLKAEWALDDDRIVIVPAALGARSGVARAESQSGHMTSLALDGEGSTEIRIESLDAYLAGARASFIKADVEGMEMDLLEGAKSTIATYRPRLAICVYHYPTDIPTISHYLKSLVPDYRFALRHHSPQLMETVLYAWVD